MEEEGEGGDAGCGGWFLEKKCLMVEKRLVLFGGMSLFLEREEGEEG